ncbi:hypothetical protein D9619_009515 [Psilocybe cf. subviscida]|uniref:Uncharacterized protein n=1 Tax=Psilocybe cf. subviscida TaxID=2480587 RepID=A0A8H5BV01_9AGAR|nr:hypothetical protein D9619_009515 [Psilocybe cf. subviscida]
MGASRKFASVTSGDVTLARRDARAGQPESSLDRSQGSVPQHQPTYIHVIDDHDEDEMSTNGPSSGSGSAPEATARRSTGDSSTVSVGGDRSRQPTDPRDLPHASHPPPTQRTRRPSSASTRSTSTSTATMRPPKMIRNIASNTSLRRGASLSVAASSPTAASSGSDNSAGMAPSVSLVFAEPEMATASASNSDSAGGGRSSSTGSGVTMSAQQALAMSINASGSGSGTSASEKADVASPRPPAPPASAPPVLSSGSAAVLPTLHVDSGPDNAAAPELSTTTLSSPTSSSSSAAPTSPSASTSTSKSTAPKSPSKKHKSWFSSLTRSSGSGARMALNQAQGQSSGQTRSSTTVSSATNSSSATTASAPKVPEPDSQKHDTNNATRSTVEVNVLPPTPALEAEPVFSATVSAPGPALEPGTTERVESRPTTPSQPSSSSSPRALRKPQSRIPTLSSSSLSSSPPSTPTKSIPIVSSPLAAGSGSSPSASGLVTPRSPPPSSSPRSRLGFLTGSPSRSSTMQSSTPKASSVKSAKSIPAPLALSSPARKASAVTSASSSTSTLTSSPAIISTTTTMASAEVEATSTEDPLAPKATGLVSAVTGQTSVQMLEQAVRREEERAREAIKVEEVKEPGEINMSSSTLASTHQRTRTASTASIQIPTRPPLRPVTPPPSYPLGVGLGIGAAGVLSPSASVSISPTISTLSPPVSTSAATEGGTTSQTVASAIPTKPQPSSSSSFFSFFSSTSTSTPDKHEEETPPVYTASERRMVASPLTSNTLPELARQDTRGTIGTMDSVDSEAPVHTPPMPLSPTLSPSVPAAAPGSSSAPDSSSTITTNAVDAPLLSPPLEHRGTAESINPSASRFALALPLLGRWGVGSGSMIGGSDVEKGKESQEEIGKADEGMNGACFFLPVMFSACRFFSPSPV